ncbi:putative phage-like baseplate assembly protein [Prevotella intermedia 17]|nr:putative phage-like baseplate assembly protein [Prevotella intermedia 17]
MHTGWVRVMTPDAGKSGDVSSNRGFVFIPEVGDQVLLGFRHGDPGRPYVMGSLFNGSTGGGGGQGNKCKSLTTRSGSSLKLDDSDGSVTLHDKGGVSMNFDGAGNATTSAKSDYTVKAGTKVSVNAGGSASTNVGKGSSILQMDKNGIIDLSAQDKITLKVGNSTITITGESIKLKSKMVDIDGSGGTLHAQGIVEIDGGDIFIN